MDNSYFNWRAYAWIFLSLQIHQQFIKNVYKSIGLVAIFNYWKIEKYSIKCNCDVSSDKIHSFIKRSGFLKLRLLPLKHEEQLDIKLEGNVIVEGQI